MGKFPKNMKQYEEDLLNAFHQGMNAGYGVEHENIREEELDAAIEFCERSGFKNYGRLVYPYGFIVPEGYEYKVKIIKIKKKD